jgi:hypothetical protein
MTVPFHVRAFICLCILLSGYPAGFPAIHSADGRDRPDTLIVDYARVINDTRRRQIGINTSFLMDDDGNTLRHPKRRYNDALKELGVRYLRYPGGWKSDVVFWSAPPHEKPSPTLAYRGPKLWPSSDTAFVKRDGSWKIDPYDFDEFMETCREVGAEPVVVVCYNSLRWPGGEGVSKPGWNEILENAVSWVRYANVTRKYGVRYWEIGNETYLGDTGQNDRGKWIIPPDVYGADLAEIARAMKSVDPSIQIGANGDSREYWSGIFDKAAEVIDFLAVHTYPLYGLKDYRDYLDRVFDLFSPMVTAKAAAAAHSGFSGRSIRLMMTEFAAGTFDRWDASGSDLARAVITFDLQGQLLQNPDCYFSQFWKHPKRLRGRQQRVQRAQMGQFPDRGGPGAFDMGNVSRGRHDPVRRDATRQVFRDQNGREGADRFRGEQGHSGASGGSCHPEYAGRFRGRGEMGVSRGFAVRSESIVLQGGGFAGIQGRFKCPARSGVSRHVPIQVTGKMRALGSPQSWTRLID